MLLIGFAALIGCRMPNILRGRFWAEDADFFADALTMPFAQAMMTPHTGYLDIIASLAGQAAALVPLHLAPMASCAVAFAVQCLPALLLVTSRIPWLQSRSRLILALLLVATPPLSEEVWINPITSQYHLMLCGGLILAERTRLGAVGALHYGILALAPFAGPGNSFLIPLYAFRAWRDRSWARAAQAATLTVGTLVQLCMLATHLQAQRHLGIEPELLLAVVYVKHLLIPLLGHAHAFDVGGNLYDLYLEDRLPLLPSIMVVLAALLFGTALWRAGNWESRWFALGALVMMVLSYFGAFGGQANLLKMGFGIRYQYAPQVLLGLALLGLATTSIGHVRQGARIAVMWLAFVGVHEFFWVTPTMAYGPSWRAQIRERVDSSSPTVIQVWPAPWRMVLPPQDR